MYGEKFKIRILCFIQKRDNVTITEIELYLSKEMNQKFFSKYNFRKRIYNYLEKLTKEEVVKKIKAVDFQTNSVYSKYKYIYESF